MKHIALKLKSRAIASIAYQTEDPADIKSIECIANIIVLKQNTPPTCDIKLISILVNSVISLNFSNQVHDVEDDIDALRIKIKGVPIEGRLFDQFGNQILVNDIYSIADLRYKAAPIAGIDSFAYVVLDTNNTESSKCTMNIEISDNSKEKPSWIETTGGIASIATIVGFIIGIPSVYIAYKKCCKAECKYKAHIGIDLDNDGYISVIPLHKSHTYFDYSGHGELKLTSWVAAKDRLLVYDSNHDGCVDSTNEFVLTSWAVGAKTDFEALLAAFDNNHDMVFDGNDVYFHDFYVWQDKNSNGVSEMREMRSLQEAGIVR